MNAVIDDQKSQWYRLLDASRVQARAALEGVGPEQVIYPESRWTLKDVLAHLTTWEVEIATSIQAFAQGRGYSIVNYRGREQYNQRAYLQNRETEYDVILLDWNAVRAGLKYALKAVPIARLDRLVMAPWEGRVPLKALIEDVIAHEAEHAAAIRQATGKPAV